MSLRVFAPQSNTALEAGRVVELDKDETHYLKRVRRAREEQELELLDGRCHRYRARICRGLGESKRAKVELLERLPAAAPHPRRTLLLGQIDKGPALEALTDAVVMGVHDLAWVDCARSQGRGPSAERIERAIRAAQRQCGRPDRPNLHHFASLDAALDAEFPGELIWASLADPEESSAPTHTHLNAPLRLAIGPEGGFDPAEVALLRSRGAQPLQIGPWVLRSERAVVATLARLFVGSSRPPSP
jgi:16S rRNA (uracil1498-N3)-methyltransferase